jgi:hypothetical protein
MMEGRKRERNCDDSQIHKMRREHGRREERR